MESSTVNEMPIDNSLEDLDERLESVCRACLGAAEPPNPLFFIEKNHESLADLVWMCAGIRFIKGDGLPEVICSKCCSDLSTANRFRNRVHQVDQLLQKYTLAKLNTQIDDNIEMEENDILIKTELTTDDDTNHKLTEIKMELEETDHYDEKDPIDSEDNDDEEDEKKPKMFICHLCKQSLKTKFSLKLHLQRMHGGKRKRHPTVSGRGSERRYHCTECSYMARRTQTLQYHMRIHTGEKPYKCDECDSSFAQPGSLSSHKKTHSAKRDFTCEECGKQFKYRGNYISHKLVHFSDKKFPCTFCDKKFNNRVTLRVHLERHINSKNFNCETCGATFNAKGDLNNHIKTHTKEKKLACHLCKYATNNKTALENHLKRHSGVRSFNCSTCEYSFYNRGDLKCHMRKHTKEKNYTCPVCKKKFRYGTCVNKHMLKSHGIKYKWGDERDRRLLK